MPVTQWPDATSGGLEGASSDKCPTEIQYSEQGFKWGFQISDFGQRHQWFKLALDPSQSRNVSSLALQYPDLNAAPTAYAQSPERLTTDYLTALRCHAEKILRHKLPESALASTPIEFIITVPAVWSDSAQASTRRCAEQAGMGTGTNLHVISEPEAAAMYALDAMDPHNIQVGDTFVLCDAGGGTVDLISYKVSALKPVLRIVEAAPGSGSLCGSTFLNRIFQRFLKDRFEDDPNWDEDVLEEAMKRFEVTVKRSFNGNLDDEYQIPGGFGQNVYLRDCIRQAVVGRGIEVMQSPSGWTAVVRGALMKGLASTNSNFTAVKISGRSARKHYGGEIVEENKPKRIYFYRTFTTSSPPPVTLGLLTSTCASHNEMGPSKYKDGRVQDLVTVTADLSRIPVHRLPQALGADGLSYYRIDFAIEITYYSGHTTYALVHDNINYGPVAAEYV
ncbi:MAG: hypothetical protein Q9216_000808 [Gyalolechia sp. 2 TL-2023]